MAGLPPWEKNGWPEEVLTKIYREWGIDNSKKQRFDVATKNYIKSLAIDDRDARAYYFRSRCQSEIGHGEEALKDATKSYDIDHKSHPTNLQVCDAWYELNNFEQCKVELTRKMKRFKKCMVEPFDNRIEVVDENFRDSMGEYLGPFLVKTRKYFSQILEDIYNETHEDLRPMWKRLKEAGECDVVSIKQEEEIVLHPREIARRDLYFKVLNQVYFRRMWFDVYFMKGLQASKKMLLEQTRFSTPILADCIRSKYDTSIKFLRMLQARSPLYAERFKMTPNQDVAKKFEEDHLYRIQYQTRRDMFIILAKVKELRRRNKLKSLISYIEKVMGDYVTIKTFRVMPRKFEFINEVYNILALAYTDQLVVPEDLMSVPARNRLMTLMQLQADKDKDTVAAYEFGNKDTYQEPDAIDYSYIAYKKLVTRLEKRLHFAKYPIERCYLQHQIARNHLSQGKFEECNSVVKKSLEEAVLCKNYLWMFLGYLMICKANIQQRKLEITSDSLKKARRIAKRLGNDRISGFLQTCQGINDQMIILKKKASGEDMTGQKRHDGQQEGQQQEGQEGQEGQQPQAT